MKRGADFSPCRTYRYTLTRHWDEEKPYVLFISLNPSMSDETNDNATNIRGIRFAEDWGYGGVVFCNLFAFRSPFPKGLKKSKSPIGEENDDWLLKEADKAGIIILSWGNHGKFLDRNEEVKDLLKHKNLYHLGITKEGEPKHILYLKKSLKPKKFKI